MAIYFRMVNILSLGLFYLIYSTGMNQINPEYRILPTNECEQYIIKNGLELRQFSMHYSIPSQAGLVYTLPNGEFVLVPSHSKPSYPGIIFRDAAIFKKYCEKDFFPIEKKDMTWLEAHAENMKHFNVDSSFYIAPLENKFFIKFPFTTSDDFEELFYKIVGCVKDKKTKGSEKESLIYCFALSIIEYLNTVKHFKLDLVKYHEIYNPYFEPIIIFQSGRRVNVISYLFIAMDNPGKDSFRSFRHYVGL